MTGDYEQHHTMFDHHRPKPSARYGSLDHNQGRCCARERLCVHGPAVDLPQVVASVSRGRSKRPGETRACDAPRFGAVCLKKLNAFSNENAVVGLSIGKFGKSFSGLEVGFQSMKIVEVRDLGSTGIKRSDSCEPCSPVHASRKQVNPPRPIIGRPGRAFINLAPIGATKLMNYLPLSENDCQPLTEYIQKRNT